MEKMATRQYSALSPLVIAPEDYDLAKIRDGYQGMITIPEGGKWREER